MAINDPGTARLTIPEGSGFARLLFRCNGHPTNAICTIGFSLTRDGDDPNALQDQPGEVARLIGEAWAGAVHDEDVMDSWSFDGVEASVLQTNQTTGGPIQDPMVGQWLEGYAGTLNGQALPCNVAFLAKKLTGSGGKHNRGRMYLPPAFIGESAIDAHGQMTNIERGGLQDKLSQFKANIDDLDEGIKLVLLHGARKVAGALVPGGVPTLITTLVLDGLIATQRRRLGR